MYASVPRSQKRVLDPLELQALVNYLMLVLDTKRD